MVKHSTKRKTLVTTITGGERLDQHIWDPCPHPAEKKKNIISTKDVLREGNETLYKRGDRAMKGDARILWAVPVRKYLGVPGVGGARL